MPMGYEPGPNEHGEYPYALEGPGSGILGTEGPGTGMRGKNDPGIFGAWGAASYGNWPRPFAMPRAGSPEWWDMVRRDNWPLHLIYSAIQQETSAPWFDVPRPPRMAAPRSRPSEMSFQ